MIYQAPVVQTSDSAIQRLNNRGLMDSAIQPLNNRGQMNFRPVHEENLNAQPFEVSCELSENIRELSINFEDDIKF